MTRRHSPEDTSTPTWPCGDERLGQPGYRLRPGRSGLDYVDSVNEAARAEGLFLKRLFTGKLRTREPAYRWAMGCTGLMGVFVGGVFMLFVVARFAAYEHTVCFAPIMIGGALLLLNLALCWRDDVQEQERERRREAWRKERWSTGRRQN